MDVVKEMREAYYRALYGNLKVNGENMPIYHYQVSIGDNPDVYGILSVSSNISADTLNSLNSEVQVQFSIIGRSITNPAVIVDSLAGDFWNIVLPSKEVTTINPNGFQIVTTNKSLDMPRPIYEDATNKTVLERVIQIGHRVYHK